MIAKSTVSMTIYIMAAITMLFKTISIWIPNPYGMLALHIISLMIGIGGLIFAFYANIDTVMKLFIGGLALEALADSATVLGLTLGTFGILVYTGLAFGFIGAISAIVCGILMDAKNFGFKISKIVICSSYFLVVLAIALALMVAQGPAYGVGLAGTICIIISMVTGAIFYGLFEYKATMDVKDSPPIVVQHVDI